MIDEATIRWYLDNGLSLTPLSMSDPDIRQRGKKPLLTNWTSRIVSPDEIRDYAAREYNLGWVIDPRHCVLDIDLRHGGQTGIERLLATYPEICTERPVVVTGSGGWHLYGEINPAINTKKDNAAYPGIALQRSGTHVVIPGSYHYVAENYYQWAAGCSGLIIPFAPDLVAAFAATDKGAVAANSPGLSGEELSQILTQIDPAQYQSNDSWFPLMAAAHHATNGLGDDAFIQWSVSDPLYAGHDALIRYRWHSLDASKGGSAITYASLLDALNKSGGQLPPAIRAKIDFSDHITEMTAYAVSSPEAAAEIRESRDRLATLDSKINTLSSSSSAKEIEAIAGEVSRLNSVTDRERLVASMQRATELKRSVIADIVARLVFARQYKEERDSSGGAARYGADVTDAILSDVGAVVALRVIDKHFDRGRSICLAPDEQLWQYTGVCWEPVMSAEIQSKLTGAIDRFKAMNPGAKVSVSSLMTQADKVFRSLVFVDKELFDEPDLDYTIVNCLNCELWIENKSGNVTPKPHSPDSRQRGVVKIDYDAAAVSPTFRQTLQEIFSHDDDKEETIRHLLELLGYAIQGYKNLPAWVLWYGPGGNGKTTILHVLQCLLGDRVLSMDIHDLDTSRSAHAYSALPGKLVIVDDDMDFHIPLPGSSLKKLSENKPLVANPKFKAQFTFNNTAICFAASNGWPASRDVTKGVRRRAHIFQLLTDLKAEFGYDYDRRQRLEGELAGILNELIAGLQRLRARGHFEIPRSANEAFGEWLKQSNPIYRFLHWLRHSTKIHRPLVTVTELWDQYRTWAIDEGHTKRMTRASFISALQSAGIRRLARKLDMSKWTDFKDMVGAVEALPVATYSYDDFKTYLDQHCDARASPRYSGRAVRYYCQTRGIPVSLAGRRIEAIHFDRRKDKDGQH